MHTSRGLLSLSAVQWSRRASPSATRFPGEWQWNRSQRARSTTQAFLSSAGIARKLVAYRRAEVIFTQGDACESVGYIQRGGVRLSVLSKAGREAIVAMLEPGDFFGEGCLAGQSVHMGSATAIMSSTILLVDKDQMVHVLHTQHALSDRFIAHLLTRKIRIEADLSDQLFNSSENDWPGRSCCSLGTASRSRRSRPSRGSRRRRWPK